MRKEVFVGREEELHELESLLKKKSASFVVVKGRRRIGKSTLIEEFSKNKKTFKFTGLAPQKNTTKQSQLDEFAKQLSKTTELPEVKVDDWSKLFNLLHIESRTGRIIIILDEISWIGSEDEDFLGKLKNAWDENFKKNPLLILIVCGSVSTWIDDNILNSKAFYGRISWTINLKPLPLIDCNRLLEFQGFKGSCYEKFKILSVTGGIPWYIEQMHGNLSADDNIRRQCFSGGGALVGEFEMIFHDVFGKNDTTYKEIVEALAEGPLEYKDIPQNTGYKSSGRLSAYLLSLEKAGFISRDFSWSLKSGNQTRISQYRLSDNYLRFYLKYMAPKLKQILDGNYKDISLSSLSEWDAIMGFQFENLVLNNRKKILKQLNIRAEEIVADNPYLQRKTADRKGCQIDYLIQTKYKNLYVCEVKFSKNPINSSIIDEVQKKIDNLQLPKALAALPVLIHVNGVAESVLEGDFFYKIIDFSELLI